MAGAKTVLASISAEARTLCFSPDRRPWTCQNDMAGRKLGQAAESEGTIPVPQASALRRHDFGVGILRRACSAGQLFVASLMCCTEALLMPAFIQRRSNHIRSAANLTRVESLFFALRTHTRRGEAQHRQKSDHRKMSHREVTGVQSSCHHPSDVHHFNGMTAIDILPWVSHFHRLANLSR